MEREEVHNSHFVASRTALWCPVCGAAEGKGCTEVKGLRFSGHNGFAIGITRPTVQIPAAWEPTAARMNMTRTKGYTPQKLVQ